MADGDRAEDAGCASLKDQGADKVAGTLSAPFELSYVEIRCIRNFEEVNRWSHYDSTLEEIDAFIRSILTAELISA